MPDEKHIVTVDGHECEVTLRHRSDHDTWQAFGTAPNGISIVCAGSPTKEDALKHWALAASKKPGAKKDAGN
jgi:hypothetical protein